MTGQIVKGPKEGAFRLFYRRNVEELGTLIENSENKVRSRDDFHHALWLIFSAGANQTAFAELHGYQPTTVSRWVNGLKAPPVMRREPIVRAAYAMLMETVSASGVVPLRSFDETDNVEAYSRPTGRPRYRSI